MNLNPIDNSGPLSPEELRKQLSEFMQQHLRSAPSAATATGTSDSDGTGADDANWRKEVLAFQRKPRDIKAHLDRFVIRQEEAKKVLSVALCDHYHHVRMALEGKEQPNYAKQNVILVGPTGVGKTYSSAAWPN